MGTLKIMTPFTTCLLYSRLKVKSRKIATSTDVSPSIKTKTFPAATDAPPHYVTADRPERRSSTTPRPTRASKRCVVVKTSSSRGWSNSENIASDEYDGCDVVAPDRHSSGTDHLSYVETSSGNI